MNLKEVVAVIGVGGIGQAIGRRQGTGRMVLLADPNQQTLGNAAEPLTSDRHAVETHPVDVSSRESVLALADALPPRSATSVIYFVHTAGVSPVQAPPRGDPRRRPPSARRWCSKSSAA